MCCDMHVLATSRSELSYTQRVDVISCCVVMCICPPHNPTGVVCIITCDTNICIHVYTNVRSMRYSIMRLRICNHSASCLYVLHTMCSMCDTAHMHDVFASCTQHAIHADHISYHSAVTIYIANTTIILFSIEVCLHETTGPARQIRPALRMHASIHAASTCRVLPSLNYSLYGTYMETWLILPVVICLYQRLSHACVCISLCTVKLRIAH